MRIFGKGKCKFIANYSATMVTSLPSLSVSLSLSLSVCISLSHRKYLTHNIGSASALPIISVSHRSCNRLSLSALAGAHWLQRRSTAITKYQSTPGILRSKNSSKVALTLRPGQYNVLREVSFNTKRRNLMHRLHVSASLSCHSKS